MDTSQTPAPDGEPQSARAKAELLNQFAEYAIGHIGHISYLFRV